MKKIHIFIRKKNSSFHQSVERFATQLKQNIKDKNLKIKIIKCPVISVGIFNRIYLIIWAFFKQGDVNHICGDINFISLFLKKKKTINTFLDCRLLYNFKGIKKVIYKFFWFQIPLNKSYINTFISDFTKKEIRKYIPIHRFKFVVIPIPLVQKYCSNIDHKKKKILIIGTETHKNIKNSLKALSNLPISLFIVGKLDKESIKLIKNNNIETKNYVNISNRELNNIYQTCNILLMPSYYEGFGMPILEAQISSMAVVTSNKEPMNKVAGKNSVLVKPDKVLSIRKAILKLIKNKRFFKKLSKLGKKNALKYDGKLVSNKYKELYLKILKNENS